MNFTQIRSFNAVASLGSFTAAAKKLNVSQSAISEQIREAEARFKIKLFLRKGNGISLTEYGKKLFDITASIDDIREQAINLLGSAKNLTSGTLRIGTVAPIHLMSLVKVFSSKYPKVDLSILFGNSEITLEKLKKKEIDVGILADISDENEIYSKPLVRDKLIAFVSKKNKLAKKKSIEFDEILDQTFIVREKGSKTRALVEKELFHIGAKKRLFEIGSREGIYEAVKQNIGIGFVYSSEKVDIPNIEFIKIKNTKFYATEYVCCLKKRYDFNVIKAFFDIIPDFLDLSKI
jgi:aminoethylphosphonate catabolism LysR family transcriptional regulator